MMWISVLLLSFTCRIITSTNDPEMFIDKIVPVANDTTYAECACYLEYEPECKCSGDRMREVPSNLHKHLIRLVIEESGLKVVDINAFQPYKLTLQEITLMNLPDFNYLEAGVFRNLRELQTIYFHGLPSLKELPPDIFNVYLPKLKILRIVHTGLEKMPYLNNLHTNSVLHMIDLENNAIRRVNTSQIKVQTIELLLNYNHIETVERHAFNGSQMAKLSLKGNKKLMNLNMEAFVGIKSLQQIDLSETSITELPTEGLEEIDILKIQDTETLKVFPSIYNFKNIQEAYLTYPCHCCAFRFPKTHNPVQYALHEQFLDLIEKACNNMTSVAPILNKHFIRKLLNVQDESLNSRNIIELYYLLRRLLNWRQFSEKYNNILIKINKQHSSTDMFLNKTDSKNESFQINQEIIRSILKIKQKIIYLNNFMNFFQTNSEDVFNLETSTQFIDHHRQRHLLNVEDSIGLKNKEFLFDHIFLRSLLDWFPINTSHRESPLNIYDSDFDMIWHNPKNGTFHNHSIDVVSGAPFAAFCGKLAKNYRDVKCFPEPDAFNPCEDLMGNWLLRVPVWFVALAAIIGNFAVALVLVSSRFRMTVPKFLMCNLSIADLCMGLYLLMIAAMDAKSIGEYFNHAIDWQSGTGCQIAGFLTIFGNVLSIFTLAVITCERWYTITWAIHLNRRLKLRTAVKIMAIGWIYALIMAALPLAGISSYSRTSICLPMEHRRPLDVLYLATLLIFNALAFALVCICYARMYQSVRGSTDIANYPHAPTMRCAPVPASRSDLTVAKRMALLVFTDFACWAPIAFFGLTALTGYPLIDVTQTKILLVFFYPLNSCANPYLYALLTQQYRRDFFTLLGRYGLCKERADKYKGAIGGVPLPRGSALQFKRPSGDSTTAARAAYVGNIGNSVAGGISDRMVFARNVGSSKHRGSSLSSSESTRKNSINNSKPGSLMVVPEFSLRSLRPEFRDINHVCNRSGPLDRNDSQQTSSIVL